MEITKKQLQRIIKEEVSHQHAAQLNEGKLEMVGNFLKKAKGATEWMAEFLENNPEFKEAVMGLLDSTESNNE